MPSFFMRAMSVVRFRPSLAAAPSGPPTRPPAWLSTRTISSRWACCTASRTLLNGNVSRLAGPVSMANVIDEVHDTLVSNVPPPALARHQTACAVERGEQRLQRVRGPPALAPPLRQRGAHRDPVQPRAEARARWKVADVAPGGQESLLQGLLAVHHHGRRDAPPTRAPRAQSPEMTPDIAIGSATE